MSESEIRFLNTEDVKALQAMQIERYGGLSGIRDQGLFESAVHMPQASFDGEFVHHGIYEMAAAYAFHIAENQPFIDGNKRAALTAAIVFLDWHDIELEEPGDELYQAMIQLAEKKLDKAGLTRLFEHLSQK